MGLPNNYSLNVPERCLDLLCALLPVVEQDAAQVLRHQGVLTTTLTLALATPMLTLPIERIEKHLGREEGLADERHLSQELASRIEQALHNKKLGDHPQFAQLDWHFLEKVPVFNIANGLPHEIAEQLGSHSALAAAKNIEFKTFLGCLRNALSHGGICYLNELGETVEGQAHMLCFVSARLDWKAPVCDKRDGRCPYVTPKIRDLRLLRISEKDFREFLRRWVSWLHQEGLQGLAAA